MACSNYSNEGTCSSWSPASNITLDQGVYVIDAGWLDGLLATPAPTWTCDSGYLDDLEGGKFVVANTSSGELLYELGLRNGDILYTINGITLDTVADGYDVYNEYRDGEDHFDLYLERDESFVTLCYSIEE